MFFLIKHHNQLPGKSIFKVTLFDLFPGSWFLIQDFVKHVRVLDPIGPSAQADGTTQASATTAKTTYQALRLADSITPSLSQYDQRPSPFRKYLLK